MSKRAPLQVSSAGRSSPAASEGASASSTLSPSFRRALQRDAEWSKEDLMLTIYWLRQMLAVVIGIVWGALQLQGMFGIASFLALSTALIFLYVTKYLGVDDEDERYGGRGSVMTEGLMPSFAMFLLSWITVYSVQQ